MTITREYNSVEQQDFITDKLKELQRAFDEAKAFQHYAESDEQASTTAMIETLSGQIEGVVAGVSIFVDDPFNLFALPAGEKAIYLDISSDWERLNDQAYPNEDEQASALKKFVEIELNMLLLNSSIASHNDVVKELTWDFEAIRNFIKNN